MEEAYYQKYCELAEEYGTPKLYDIYGTASYYGRSYLGGVCMVNFLDFNGDGTEDLFVVYANGQTNKAITDNSVLEIYDFPARDSYEIEIWTYADGQLVSLLHEPAVSIHDTSSYSYSDPAALVTQIFQLFITVFENADGAPVLQIYNYDERVNIYEYENIYFSAGDIVRDKLTYEAPVFTRNGAETTWEIWSDNVAGYDKILLAGLLADSWFGNSRMLLEGYGIDYDYTLVQTEKAVRSLRGDSVSTPPLAKWLIAEGNYISLYMQELYRANIFFCDWESGEDNTESEKFFTDHHYALYDMDNDGAPELILYEGSIGAGTHYHFYKIIDGEAVFCDSYGRTTLYGNHEGGLIAYYGRMDSYFIDKIILENTAIRTEPIADGSINDPENEGYPTLDEFGYVNYEYLPFCPKMLALAFYTYGQELNRY
jgi:hypothetical protein